MSTNHVGVGDNAVKRPDKVLAPVLWFSMRGSMAIERYFRKSGAEEVFWAVCFITPSKGVIPMYLQGELKNTRYK